VVVAVELSRLLRRVLLVAAVAVAGWLLSVVFAGTAGADERPEHDPSGGLFGDLVGGLTDTVAGVTDKVFGITETVIGTSDSVLAPTAPPPAEEAELPAILPVGSSSGTAATDRYDGLPRLDVVSAPIAVPVTPEVMPAAPPVVAPPVPAPVRPAVTAVPAAPAPTAAAQDLGDVSAEHAGEGAPEPRPVKAPAAPAGSSTTVSSSHDSSGSARGTHGVLPTQADLHPADAGFTTRSRAVDAAGRVAGLPASSPD
jgi:hypothetical protein